MEWEFEFKWYKVVFNTLLAVALTWLTWIVCLTLFVDSTAFRNPLSPIRYLPFFADLQILYLTPAAVFFTLTTVALVVTSRVDGEYGNARIATKSDIKEMGMHADKGAIYGRAAGKYLRSDENLSSLLIAPPNTGKTAAVIIPTLFSCSYSMFVNDVKGELWNKTSAYRASFGRVGIFAPTIDHPDSLGFNPLSNRCLPQDMDSAIDYIDRLAEVLWPTVDVDDTTKHFNGEAKEVFVFWALYLLVKNREYDTDEASLPGVYDVSLCSGDMQMAVMHVMENERSIIPNIMEKIGFGIINKDSREFSNTATTFKQAITPFARPSVRKHFMRCDFDYKDFRQPTPFTLYLCVPARDMDRIAPMIRMMSIYLVGEMLSEPEASIVQPVYFLLDEFPRLGKMPAVVNAPEVGRSYKLRFMFVAQSVQQLQALYGKAGVDALTRMMDTCAYNVIFTQNDDKAAEKLSNTIGKHTRKKHSSSRKDLDLSGTTSESKEGHALITAQDLLNLGKNDLVMTVQGHKKHPIKAKKTWWFQDTNMKGLAGAYNNQIIEAEINE